MPAFSPQGVMLGQQSSTSACEALPSFTRDGPQSFRALLDTSLVTPNDEVFSFRYAVASKQPERLRVDLLPVEGAYTLGLLVVRGAEALVLDSQSKRYSSGCEAKAVFEKFFSLRGVTPDVVQGLLVGRIAGVQCAAAQVYRQSSSRLLLVDTIARQAWEVDEASGVVQSVTLLDDSLEHVQVRATRSYPPQQDKIHVEIYRPVTASATMKVRRLTINPAISDQLFQVAVPHGYEDEGC